MIEKTTTQSVLEMFFENPAQQFHLRELSRKLDLSMPTILTTTQKLYEKNLITRKKGTVLTIVSANRENQQFIRLKRIFNLEQIYESSIVEYLTESYNHPSAIILFGSYSRGEDIEKSDIDLAVVTNKKKSLPLEKYQKKLKRTINIHEINLTKISSEFKTNLANGIVLEGTL